jgi:hypothetical protein
VTTHLERDDLVWFSNPLPLHEHWRGELCVVLTVFTSGDGTRTCSVRALSVAHTQCVTTTTALFEELYLAMRKPTIS